MATYRPTPGGGPHPIPSMLYLAGASAGEAVADSRIGADQLGAATGLDLAAQVGDVGTQHLGIVGVARSPHLLQQVAVGHQAAPVADQQSQEVELGLGQVDLLAGPTDGPGGEIDLELSGD